MGRARDIANLINSGTFITPASASATYLSQTSASTTYLQQNTASATYLPLSGGMVTGPIVTPNRPAFSAYLNTGSYSSGSYIIFDQINYNIGSHYNSSNGIFTAPYAGIYAFGGHVITPRNTTGGDLYWDLYKNSSIVQRFYDAAEGGGSSVHLQTFGYTTIQLSTSDTVRFNLASSSKGAVTGNSIHCLFYGHYVG